MVGIVIIKIKMSKTIIMESTFLLLPEKDKREALKKGKVVELKTETGTVKYLIIENND